MDGNQKVWDKAEIRIKPWRSKKNILHWKDAHYAVQLNEKWTDKIRAQKFIIKWSLQTIPKGQIQSAFNLQPK